MYKEFYLFRGRYWPVTVFAAAISLTATCRLIERDPWPMLFVLGLVLIWANFSRNTEKTMAPDFSSFVMVIAVSAVTTFILTDITGKFVSVPKNQIFAAISIFLGTASILLNPEFRWRVWPLFFFAMTVEALGFALFFRDLIRESLSFGLLLYVVCRFGLYCDEKLIERDNRRIELDEITGI